MIIEIDNNKKTKKRQSNRNHKTSLELRNINPITKNQHGAFKIFEEGKHLVLHGVAGTGKTFCALYLALKSVFSNEYQRIIIVRSIVPTRDIGFLPGSIKDKIRIYENPYVSICQELFDRGDSYDILKTKGLVEFTSTSFLRGMNFNNSIVIIDEIQNLTFHEIDSIITRIGKNCRIIFSGDIRQSDLNKGKEFSGLRDFIKIIKKMKSFSFIEFGIDDICRSSIVKEYIITKLTLEDMDEIHK